MKFLMPALKLVIFMTLLLGLAYPLAMTALSQIFFPQSANGEWLYRGGQNVGSKLIAQNFEKPEYFWPRPSAVGFNPLPSGGSNLSWVSEDLKKAVEERRIRLKKAHPDSSIEPPSELLFTSASGLDPHLSPEAVKYQAARVASARKMNIQEVNQLIAELTEKRSFGLLGEPTVKVLVLNLALDRAQGIDSAPQFVPSETK